MTKLIDTPLVTRLDDYALLSVSGNDRHTFLHGQLINDLNLIEQASTQLSAWCNPKGQVISNFVIINTGIAYLLLFKSDLKEFVQKRLGMFVLRSDVQIEDISDHPLIGLANIDDVNLLGIDSVLNTGEVKAVDGLVIIALPAGSNRYLILGNTEKVNKKEAELTALIKPAESNTWELLDILGGLPWVTTTTQEQFLPQMLNLDALNALSYQKGCYPGQEVIARLHYRGEVKKRLQLIKSKQQLPIGESIHAENTDKNVGNVINSTTHTDAQAYSLAVIELDKLNGKLICDNQELTLLDLPYAVES